MRAGAGGERWAGAVAVVVLTLLGAAPAIALEQKLTAPDGVANNYFGFSVAIDGDTAAVGAPNDGNGGAVYVFTRTGDAWDLSAKLTSSDGAPGDALGSSVAIDGDTIVAGANSDRIGADDAQGSVYTFARTGPVARSETAKLTASDGGTFDQLGSSVAVDGDTIVAGAYAHNVGANGNQGSAYTFARTGPAARIETAKLTASDGAPGDELGYSVAIDGDAIVAGAPSDDNGGNGDQGSAYTFARTGPFARTQTAKLSASDGAATDFLGWSVAIDGDTIVAGAPGDSVGANADQGSAYTFASTGLAVRAETAKLTASDGAPSDNLAYTVAVDGDTIVAGALEEDDSQGSAYTFARAGATRTETAKLTAADGAAGDELGSSVAIDGGSIIAGAWFDDVGANADQGSAQVFFDPLPLTLTLGAKKKQELEKLALRATCSSPCELSARAKGKAEKKFKSKRAEGSLAAADETKLRLKLPKSKLERIDDERGKATITATATDAYDQTATESVKVKIKP
jgi:FG-GAP repeat